MVLAGRPGRIVFISSTVGLMGMFGYSQYAPTKFALRGLCECLNQEFLTSNIRFHVYFVASINTPGFAAEEQRKPLITKKLEGSDVSGDQSPLARAALLLDGLERDEVFIASDFFTRILLASSAGINVGLSDALYSVAGWIILPFVRIYFNHIISSKRC